jgi:hypothetical protein
MDIERKCTSAVTCSQNKTHCTHSGIMSMLITSILSVLEAECEEKAGIEEGDFEAKSCGPGGF